MNKRKKIAILGGGMGALSAAYWLTDQPDWQDKYEITVYQLGYRLGGKGATARDPENYFRIEEHGFHFFPGFYENTFRMMRACYAELARGPDSPFAEFIAENLEDERLYPNRYAMLRQNYGQMYQWFDRWHMVEIFAPFNAGLPGNGRAFLTYRSYIEMIFEWLLEISVNALDWIPAEDRDTPTKLSPSPEWLGDLIRLPGYHALRLDFNSAGFRSHPGLYVSHILAHQLPLSLDVDEGGDADSEATTSISQFIIARLREYLTSLWNNVKTDTSTAYQSFRAWTMIDFLATNLIGLLSEDVLRSGDGLQAINNVDYARWLLKNATVLEGTRITINSPMVNFVYDAGFACLNNARDLEAGTAVQIGLRMFVDFRGSPFWMFRLGCGDALFAPLYEVLDRRGVKFNFFNRVERLHVDTSRSYEQSICGIDLIEQATLKVDKYDPLITVNGMRCWPLHPDYGQIVDGDLLESLNLDLNSVWSENSAWDRYMTKRRLHCGQDFDEVILGIPVGAFDEICCELIENKQDPAWANMFTHVKTTCTQSLQVYLNKAADEVGWVGQKALMETSLLPYSTWADMSHLIDQESWPEDKHLRSIHFFVGAVVDCHKDNFEDVAKENALYFLDDVATTLWPRFCKKRDLVDHLPRVNAEPWSRYVLSGVGSSDARLAADDSHYTNLYLAGDWVKTGLNYGCMEAAVMSGMQVSRALTAYPSTIVGETAFGTNEPTPLDPVKATALTIESSALRRKLGL